METIVEKPKRDLHKVKVWLLVIGLVVLFVSIVLTWGFRSSWQEPLPPESNGSTPTPTTQAK
jgi:hypothetical protein